MSLIRSLIRELVTPLSDGFQNELGGAVQATAGWWPLIVDRYAHSNGATLSPISSYHVALDRNSAATVVDHEGIVRACLPNELRFQGARRVENLADKPLDMTDNAWNKTRCTVVDNSDGSFRMTATEDIGFVRQLLPLTGQLINTIDIKRVSGNGVVNLYTGAGISVEIIPSLLTSWQRITLGVSTAGGANDTIGVRLLTGGDVVDIRKPQMESVTDQAVQTPSEFVEDNDSACSVSDIPVRYFNTTNENSVDVNGVVTEAAGSAVIPDGLLIEEQSTNLFTESNDVTNWSISGGATLDDYQTITFTEQYDGAYISLGTIDSESYTITFKARNIDGNTGIAIWHYFSATGNSTAITLTSSFQDFEVTILGRAGGGSVTFGITDDKASGHGAIEIKDFNVVNAAYKTSHIPTSGASATRLADNAQTLWPADLVNDFVIGCDFIRNSLSGGGTGALIHSSTSATYITISSSSRLGFRADATQLTGDAYDSVILGNSYNGAYRKSSTQGLTIFQDGVNIKDDGGTDIVNITAPTDFNIGAYSRLSPADRALNGTIKNISFRKGDLTDDEVING